jgi:hypothetical protein
MSSVLYASRDINSHEHVGLLADTSRPSQEWIRMENTTSSPLDNKRPAESRGTTAGTVSLSNVESNVPLDPGADLQSQSEAPQFRVYKRRWFGLLQLVLLNIVVSWDVSCQLHFH